MPGASAHLLTENSPITKSHSDSLCTETTWSPINQSRRSIFRLLLRYASRYRRQTSRWMRSQLQTSEPPRPRTRGVSTCPSRCPMHSGGSLEASTHSAAGPLIRTPPPLKRQTEKERERPLLRDLTLLQTIGIRPDSVSRLLNFYMCNAPIRVLPCLSPLSGSAHYCDIVGQCDSEWLSVKVLFITWGL